MVFITLVPARGNATKYFPHSGYLGLSPVEFKGTFRTIRAPDERRAPAARAIELAVRCYECRLNKAGNVHKQYVLAEHEITLWRCADADRPEEIGEWEIPFKITLPPTFGGVSAVCHQEYKVHWKLEAVIDHVHMLGFGTRQVKSYDLALTRYNLPPPLPPPASPFLAVPNEPVGPEDAFPVTFHLPSPPPYMAYHRVALGIERQLEFPEASPPSSPEAHRSSFLGTVFATRPSSSGSGASAPATIGRSASPPRRSPSPSRPSTSPGTSARVSHHMIMTSDHMLEPYTREQHVKLALPKPPSSGHWSLGETALTPLCSSRFFVRARVHYMPVQPSHGGGLPVGVTVPEPIDLPPAELLVTVMSNPTREMALNKLSARRSRSPPSYSNSPSYTTLPVPIEPSLPPPPPLTSRPGPCPSRPILRRPRTAGSSSTSSSRPLRHRRSQDHLPMPPSQQLPQTPALSHPGSASPPSSSSSVSTLHAPAVEIFLSPAPPPSPKRCTPPTSSDPPARRTKARLLPAHLSLSGSSGRRSSSPHVLPMISPASAGAPGVTDLMAPEHVAAWEQEVERINTAGARGRIGLPYVGAAR